MPKKYEIEIHSRSDFENPSQHQILNHPNEQTPNRTDVKKIWTFLIERNTVGSAWGTHTRAYKLYMNKLNNTQGGLDAKQGTKTTD